MKSFFYATLTWLLASCSFGLFAQSGQFDVRFLMNAVECPELELFVDVEIKASSAATTFNMSDQNYRFSFNRSAVSAVIPPIDAPLTNPPDRSVFIEQELDVSGFVSVDGSFSFYDAHTLTGTIDTVVSYNVKLAGGDGFPINENDWVKVGRLRLNMLNNNVCVSLTWHTSDPADFPPTFIGEKVSGLLYAVSEGTYTDLMYCFADGCPLPVELISFEGMDTGCAVDLNWKTATEINNDFFRVEKSIDGLSFRQIGIVQGAGNTTDVQQYTFRDEDVAVNNYYRIVQVDYDGTETAHQTIQVRSACFDDVLNGISEIFPNPVGPDEEVSLKFYTDRLDTEAVLRITDLLGRVVDQSVVNLIPGANTLVYEPAQLPSGAYFIQVTGNDWYSAPQKFVKINTP